LGETCSAYPHQGVLAAVARGKQGLEPHSAGLDEETVNLDFVMEDERFKCPTFMRFSTVKKLTVRKQRESVW